MPLSRQEKQLKLAKFLCRSFDNRWSTSRPWDDIPEDSRREWFADAGDILDMLEDDTLPYKDPYWPVE